MSRMDRPKLAGDLLSALVREAQSGEKVAVHVRGDEVTISVDLPLNKEGWWQPGWEGKTTFADLHRGLETFGDLTGQAQYSLEMARSDD